MKIFEHTSNQKCKLLWYTLFHVSERQEYKEWMFPGTVRKSGSAHPLTEPTSR